MQERWLSLFTYKYIYIVLVNKMFTENNNSKFPIIKISKDELLDSIMSFDILNATDEDIRNFLAWLQIEASYICMSAQPEET